MNTSKPSLTRADVLIRGLLLILIAFTVRLFYLQIIKHDEYVAKARDIQVQPLTIMPVRGQIYAKDASGEIVPLVLNEKVYTLFVDQTMIKNEAKTAEILQKIAGGNLVSGYRDHIKKDSKNRYVVLGRNVSRAQAELIRKEDLSGIGLQQTNRRVYPEGQLAAQVLGYVNNDGLGQYGVEEALNERLKGTPGLLQTVTDVRRIPLTIGKEDINIPAKNGDNIVLSIDRTVQNKAEELLKDGLKKARATKGSMIVMDPNNGQVVAMAAYPSYDPAKYNEVENYEVFQNPIVSSPYENGSVIKALTVGAAIDNGAVDENTTFNDITGCTRVEDRRICNVEEDPKTADATMLDTLRYSLNTGVVYALSQMGGGSVNKQARDTLYDYFHNRYHFGQLTGIEQAGESEGVIISPDKQEGNNVRYANMAFGQGMDQTMIQTASAFSAEINGGTYYQPTLVAGVRNEDGKMQKKDPIVVRENVLAKESSQRVREMIYQARKKGFFGKNDREGYMVGGKTGTSQVIDAHTGEYTDKNSIGSYLGFGGTDTPQYVIMVKVDDSKLPGYQGTTAAGPIFNGMSNWMIDYLKLQPKV